MNFAIVVLQIHICSGGVGGYGRVRGCGLGTGDESNLATGIGGDSGIRVLDNGVHFAARVKKRANERQIQPLALALGADDAMWGKSIV